MSCGWELWAESCSSTVELSVVSGGLSVFLTSGGGSLLCRDPAGDEEEAMEGVEECKGEGITRLGGGWMWRGGCCGCFCEGIPMLVSRSNSSISLLSLPILSGALTRAGTLGRCVTRTFDDDLTSSATMLAFVVAAVVSMLMS